MYTETERWVNGVCDGLVRGGRVRLYRDLYKDLREKLPCGDACRLIEDGLRLSRTLCLTQGGTPAWETMGGRARAIAALKRLARWAEWRGRYGLLRAAWAAEGSV